MHSPNKFILVTLLTTTFFCCFLFFKIFVSMLIRNQLLIFLLMSKLYLSHNWRKVCSPSMFLERVCESLDYILIEHAASWLPSPSQSLISLCSSFSVQVLNQQQKVTFSLLWGLTFFSWQFLIFLWRWSNFFIVNLYFHLLF